MPRFFIFYLKSHGHVFVSLNSLFHNATIPCTFRIITKMRILMK